MIEKVYTHVGDLSSDFRNRNLNNLVASNFYGKTLLDIGCGAGHLVNLARKNDMLALGLEPNKNLISLAKKIYGDDISILNMNAEQAKSLRRKFDTIVLIDVLEHLENDTSILKTINKLLNKNGRIILVVPAYQLLYGNRDKKIGHYRRYSKKDLIIKLTNNGFKIIKIRYWNILGFFPYFIFEKILKRNLLTEFRENKNNNIGIQIVKSSLNFWFKHFENNINFRFGLSLIVTVEKE